MRELRQNASKLLQRVADGETLVITNHGREVARLVPPSPKQVTRSEMIAQGRLIPGHGDVLDFTPVALPPGTPSSAEILAKLREERL